jgi:hypothetical protein
MNATCPACGRRSARVLCYGFPMWICECEVLWGFWSWVPVLLPFNGMFLAYTPGHYFGALWRYLTGSKP